MAQFRGVLSGGRGTASRLGHKTSGLTADVNGWRSGVTVVARYNEALDRDEFTIYATTGSSGGGQSFTIGEAFEHDGEIVFNPGMSLADVGSANGVSFPVTA